MISGNNTWAVSVVHGVGVGEYYDNKGASATKLDDYRIAGTVTDDATISGIYPFFWGVANTTLTESEIGNIITQGGANKVILPASGTITIDYNATGKFLWFAHLSTYTTKTRWYVTALNQGDIGSASDLFDAPNTTTVDSPDAYWTNKQYKIYITNYATDLIVPIELRNS